MSSIQQKLRVIRIILVIIMTISLSLVVYNFQRILVELISDASLTEEYLGFTLLMITVLETVCDKTKKIT